MSCPTWFRDLFIRAPRGPRPNLLPIPRRRDDWPLWLQRDFPELRRPGCAQPADRKAGCPPQHGVGRR